MDRVQQLFLQSSDMLFKRQGIFPFVRWGQKFENLENPPRKNLQVRNRLVRENRPSDPGYKEPGVRVPQ